MEGREGGGKGALAERLADGKRRQTKQLQIRCAVCVGESWFDCTFLGTCATGCCNACMHACICLSIAPPPLVICTSLALPPSYPALHYVSEPGQRSFAHGPRAED